MAAIGGWILPPSVLFFALGGLLIASDDSYGSELGAGLFVPGLIGTVAGGGMLWWGYDTWSSSVDAARVVAGPIVSVAPTMLLNAQGQPRAGVGLSFTY